MRLAGLRSRLSYANVASTLALLLALGGAGAYAAAKIGSSDIKDNAVRSRHIKNGEVTGKDVKESSLKGVDASKLGGLKGSDFTQGASGSEGGTTGVSRKLIDESGSPGPAATLADVPGVGKAQVTCASDGVANFDVTKDASRSGVGAVIGIAIHEDPNSTETFNDVIDGHLTGAHPTRGTPAVAPGGVGQFTAQLFYADSTPAQYVATFVTSVEAEPSNHPNQCLAVTQWWSNTSASASSP